MDCISWIIAAVYHFLQTGLTDNEILNILHCLIYFTVRIECFFIINSGMPLTQAIMQLVGSKQIRSNGRMLQCQQHLFHAFCIITNILDDPKQQVFFAPMTSCAVHYVVIYYPIAINFQYLKTWGAGVDNPARMSPIVRIRRSITVLKTRKTAMF